ELRRQRALIAEHLAWLDRQIAEAGGMATPAAQPAPQATPTPLAPPGPTPLPKVETAGVVAAALKASVAAATNPPESPEVAAKANAILDEYRTPEASLKTDVRKGCMLYFAAAMGLLAIGV